MPVTMEILARKMMPAWTETASEDLHSNAMTIILAPMTPVIPGPDVYLRATGQPATTVLSAQQWIYVPTGYARVRENSAVMTTTNVLQMSAAKKQAVPQPL